mmetsp:Transcript_1792/g.4145  ORF Transcript_1792/g.4145 Transcript_1792/m.4145 type:complete len:208 (-) Transcript_1792:1433-2056(-)
MPPGMVHPLLRLVQLSPRQSRHLCQRRLDVVGRLRSLRRSPRHLRHSHPRSHPSSHPLCLQRRRPRMSPSLLLRRPLSIGEETWSPTKDSSTNVGASTEPPPGIGVRPLRNTPPAWASTGPRHGSGWEPVGEVWLPRRRRRGTRQTTLGGVLRSFRRTRPTDRGTRCQGRRGTRIGARGTRKAPFAAFLCTSRRARTGNWGGWHWDG